jgi:ABC-type branched-subunit amino acid transport system substrate-binding protein
VTRKRILAGFLALGLVATACGRSDDTTQPAGGGGGGGAPSTTAAADAACEGVTLEATDTGVSADTITIQVMADTGSPLAPGLFQGNIDAVEAFAEHVNDNGGIGCRQLEVEAWDSKLTPEETKNGQINACNSALALVGGNSLFNPDVTTMNTCADREGKPTGIPNVAALANDINEQCSKNTFVISTTSENCGPDGTPPSGVRPLTTFIGSVDFYETVTPNLKGIYLVPGDLPTTVQSATYNVAAQAEAGVDWAGVVKVSGRSEQSAYTPVVQQARNGGVNYIYNGSNDATMVNMRREAAAQGLDIDVWACSVACYTSKFAEAGADVAGTYGWLSFLPFEEKGSNEALDAYLASNSDPVSWGAQAWMAGMLFQEAVENIVEADGPNAITRASLLEALNGISSFDADGWMGPKDPKGATSDCMVMMQFDGKEWKRLQPEAAGTFDCNPDWVVDVTLDPAVEAQKIQ